MADETKQDEGQVKPPEGGDQTPQSVPNQSTPESSQTKIQELENQLKERDAQIADLSTIKATLESRFNQIYKTAASTTKDTSGIEDRARNIMENAQYNPESAARELSSLLSELKQNVSKEAVTVAQQTIAHQNVLLNLRNGVKTANPHFDDDIVEVIMERANQEASTGKYKDAQSAINAATNFVKAKFESYAQKRNAIPPLPAGAQAEIGINRQQDPTEPAKGDSPLEELEFRKATLQKKVL